MEFCKDCDKKEECVKLCKKAERYVNQDEVCLEESLVVSVDSFSEPIDYCVRDSMYDKKMIIRLFKDGRSVKDIMYHVPFCQRYIYKVIKRYKEESMNE